MSPPSEAQPNGAAISSRLQEDAAKTLNDNREYLLRAHGAQACNGKQQPGVKCNAMNAWNMNVVGILAICWDKILHRHLMETLPVKQQIRFFSCGSMI